jgi:hypothetical protein
MTALQYYIEGGVRRAVAARESGLTAISAFLYETGKPQQLIVASLTDLHSPKTSVSQSDWRYRRAARGMASVLGRAKMPPIDLQPLGEKGQPSTVPLAQVTLDP